MSIIYAIRHGQASFGQPEYDRLSALGIRQAEILGRHFARINTRFDAVYHGTLIRQKVTAETAAAQLCLSAPVPCITDPALDEYNAKIVWKHYIPLFLAEEPSLKADLNGIYTDPKAFQRLFARVMLRWIDETDGDAALPRWSDFRARAAGGLRRIMEAHGSGARIALFTSSGTISAMMGHALELSDRQTMSLFYHSMIKFFCNVLHLQHAKNLGNFHRSL